MITKNDFFGNNAKSQIQKRWLQKNKDARLRIRGWKMLVFQKIWRALFSCNQLFEIRPFAFLATIWYRVCYDMLSSLLNLKVLICWWFPKQKFLWRLSFHAKKLFCIRFDLFSNKPRSKWFERQSYDKMMHRNDNLFVFQSFTWDKCFHPKRLFSSYFITKTIQKIILKYIFTKQHIRYSSKKAFWL